MINLGRGMIIYKEKLAFIIVALLLSQQSFANGTEGFYFGAGYSGQLLSGAGPLKLKTTDKVTSDQKLSEYEGGHSPLIAFGYVGEFNNHNYRIELEGIHFSVKAEDNKNEKYFDGDESNPYKYKIEVNDEQVENTSITANIYYYWKNLFSPYVGIGIGGTRMKMFEKAQIRPAYQLKAGLDFQITEGVNMYIGYRHFGALSNYLTLEAEKFGIKDKDDRPGKRKRIYTHPQPDPQESVAEREDVGISNRLFFTHGIEVGLTLQKEAFKTRNWKPILKKSECRKKESISSMKSSKKVFKKTYASS